MKFNNLRALEKHLEGAKLLKFNPLYFILGKDSYECQEAIDLLLHFLLPSQSMREFSLFPFEGARFEEKNVDETLYSYSLFAKTRVIWIQQAEKLKKSVQERLENYFAHPPSSQYLLLSASGWQKNTSFYKAIEKEGIILEFVEVKSWEKEKHLTEWVNKKVTKMGKRISFQVCQSFVKRVGQDQKILAQELEKLLTYCSEKNEIALQDVEMICSCYPSDSIWQLGEALFRRDAVTALQITHAFLMDGQALLPLLRQIRFQYQIQFQICLLLAQGRRPQDITAEFPYMKGQILERHIGQAKFYGLESFKRGLLALDAAEMRLKNSSIDEHLLVELLMMQLTTQ